MLVTMLTVMYLMVKTVEQLTVSWTAPETLPYMVSSPLPCQVHYVSQKRRGSRPNEADGQTQLERNSGGPDTQSSNGQLPTAIPACPNKAAATIQNQYRKYQQKKQKDRK
ncbi:hypothetical protein AAFF_G00205580 [Aldrovandia affinis]|uniref:Secreted protein n=1 Tax=Aldrovandia affinis TaxID=143900 RepID=A0AAD7RHZ8_9TELE|nr:hypothetical protein AAFF_G00205580 [Aldrovandia affinis]